MRLFGISKADVTELLEPVMNIGPKKELSVFDSTCIIVGIIIGAGIYETAPTIADCMGSWISMLGVWLAGGLLALTGICAMQNWRPPILMRVGIMSI